MAQIAIPIVLIGVAYLVSNDDDKKRKDEKKEGFSEAPKSKLGDSKIPFFNLGPKNKWEKLLDSKTQKKLEEAFRYEMKELRYL